MTRRTRQVSRPPVSSGRGGSWETHGMAREVQHHRRRRPGHDGRRASRRSSPATASRRRRRADRRAGGARRAHVQHSTDRAVKRGKLSRRTQQAIFDRLTLTTSLADLKDCDLVVEAVVEHLDLKRSIFQQLDEIVRPDAVLATNTSSLSSPRSRRPPRTRPGRSGCTSSTRRRCSSSSR